MKEQQNIPPDLDTQLTLAYTHSDLVSMLDDLFPERSPRPEDTEREIWMRAGERRLIRRLQDQAEDAQRRGLVSKLRS